MRMVRLRHIQINLLNFSNIPGNSKNRESLVQMFFTEMNMLHQTFCGYKMGKKVGRAKVGMASDFRSSAAPLQPRETSPETQRS